jgi:hypothetical protein
MKASTQAQIRITAEDARQVREVMLTLRAYRDEIDRISSRIEGKPSITQDEKEDLQADLKALKERLRQSAKTGTVNGEKRTQNKIERAYFARAVLQASANLRIAVNSHPVRSNWVSALYSIRIDITLPLSQLESQFPGL